MYRYGVPGGKFFAPSQADAEALVAQHPDRFAQGDFIYPRQGARSMANPEGTASGPDPVGVFVMLSPSDLSYRNGQKQLQEMQGEGAKGGLPTTISAREKRSASSGRLCASKTRAAPVRALTGAIAAVVESVRRRSSSSGSSSIQSAFLPALSPLRADASVNAAHTTAFVWTG